jgi:4-amino-4-deoxy-L-arabinose transferase-like glycosyltransferase
MRRWQEERKFFVRQQSSAALFVLFFSFIAILLFSRAMNRTFSHDEHQFITSSELLLTQQSLPFRDYPYQHLPYLTLLFALSGSLTDYSLLGARAASVLAATGCAILLFMLVGRFFRTSARGWRLLAGVTAVLVLVTNPLFYLTSGKAWNHDLPTLFTLGAVCCIGGDEQDSPTSLALFGAGFLLGLAAGTRLSYLTALPPFVGWVFLVSGRIPWQARLKRAGVLLMGFAIALLPVLFLFFLSPRGFVFGNIVYPQLNTVYRQVLRQQEAMTLGAKLIYFAETILMDWQSLLLYLAFFAVLLGAVVSWRPLGKLRRRGWFYGVLVIFLLAGSFTPTPSWSHYFYAPLPFLVLALFYALANWNRARNHPIWLLATLFPLAAGLNLYVQSDLKHLRSLGQPENWVTVRAHQLGEVLANEVGEGPVLTLAPVFPLEGGLDIYPAFATGPFTWRTAHLLSLERQRFYGITSLDTLHDYLKAAPPAAILTGFEADTAGFEPGDPGGLEKPLVDYAVLNGYQALKLKALVYEDDLLLWVLPRP